MFSNLVWMVWLAGCTGKKDSGDTEACFFGVEDVDTDTDVDWDQDTAFRVAWGGSAVEFGFSPAAHDDLLIGIVETAESEDPWTGEDCLDGYLDESGGIWGPYCHAVGSGETTLALTYGGDPDGLSAGTTVFADASYAERVTYIAYDSTGACWTWGHDPTYYSSEGCTVR